MSRFYTVSDAAKILGFSTNSIYKFLDQGRLKSTRGNSKQGRFRIPHSSIEDFLGTKLSEVAVSKALAATVKPKPDVITPRHLINPDITKDISPPKVENRAQPEKRVMSHKPALGLALTRLLILIALLLTIIEVVTAPIITLSGQFFRLLILTISILLAYQSGGSLTDQNPHDQT